uniref:Uncharacterized protein n=1 Tax=Podarcis muralis TaxID=64176 RepID=A0A670KDU1_PODMU
MSRASLTSRSSWYSISCCCIWSRISVISLSLASSIFRNFSRSPAISSSSSRIRSSAAFACRRKNSAGLGPRERKPPGVWTRTPAGGCYPPPPTGARAASVSPAPPGSGEQTQARAQARKTPCRNQGPEGPPLKAPVQETPAQTQQED